MTSALNEATDAFVPKGYAGKILRIDLTTQTVSDIDTYQYVPDYVGGKGIASKIFYDEVPPDTGAFDPANELIYMTGPACGTGLPNASRATFCSLSPKPLVDMFTWSGIGGFFGVALKYAGYDGIVLQGKAPRHTYVVIDDGKVSFEDADADGLWGQFTTEAQELIFEKYGRDYFSFVIGPAGENLLRDASITTSADNAAAKAGFGAVMGAKNLKAVVAHGTGDIEVGCDLETLYQIRAEFNTFAKIKAPNPIRVAATYGTPDGAPEGAGQQDPVPGGWSSGWLACCPGCTMRCNKLILDCTNPFTGETFNQSAKCIDTNYPVLETDCYYWLGEFIGSKLNSPSVAMQFYGDTTDTSDPHLEEILSVEEGNDRVNYWKFDFDRGNQMSYLCNEYGIDKWEPLIFFATWLSALRHEDMLKDLPFKFDVEPEFNVDFLKYFFDMVVYRRNEVGNLFAEGMSRVIRAMGKGKWGNSIYHNRYNRKGERLDVPVSLEMAWGGSVHWVGRGYQSLNEPQALQGALQVMVSSRDSQTNAHQHCTLEEYRQMEADPYHTPLMADVLYVNDIYGDLKESILSCEWTHHQPYESDQEVRMFNAATGYDLTEEQLFECGERIKTVFRALLVRNSGRTRDVEVEEIFPIMSFPNCHNWAPTWDDWNDAVDLYYDRLGWDRATGWPTRAAYERLGLGAIADDMERAGKLPHPDGSYVRKASPFTVDGHFKPEDYEPVEEPAVVFGACAR